MLFNIAIFRNVLFLALTSISMPVHASEPGAVYIDDININTGEYERLLKGVPMSIDPEMLEKARQVIPGDINERIEKERSRLIERDFQNIEATRGVSKNNNQGQVGNALHGTPILEKDERIYIFVSSSVPKETLRNYARDLDALGQPGISMVMRGFVGGMTKVRPTLEFFKGVFFKDENCNSEKCDAYQAAVLIDPLLFRRYGIEAAPAIVYAREVSGMAAVSEVKEGEAGEYYVFYGDAALDGALDLIDREVRASSLKCLLSKLRRGHDNERDCK